jgi:hypothetical protein
MRHATSLLYHVCAVALRNIRFASCGTSGKLTLWTCYVFGYILSKISLSVHLVYFVLEITWLKLWHRLQRWSKRFVCYRRFPQRGRCVSWFVATGLWLQPIQKTEGPVKRVVSWRPLCYRRLCNGNFLITLLCYLVRTREEPITMLYPTWVHDIITQQRNVVNRLRTSAWDNVEHVAYSEVGNSRFPHSFILRNDSHLFAGHVFVSW